MFAEDDATFLNLRNAFFSFHKDLKRRIARLEGEYDRLLVYTWAIEECGEEDAGDDQVPVIDGPSYSFHDHVQILKIMPLRYPLSKKLRSRYEGYYDAMVEEEKF